MGRRSTLLDFDDLALELVARAQLLHGVLLPRIRPYGTTPPLPWSPSATVLHRLPRNDEPIPNCLFDDALKRGLWRLLDGRVSPCMGRRAIFKNISADGRVRYLCVS
jgi:hypothetical protein